MFVHTPVILALIAVSANYNKLVLVNGVGTVLQNPAPDTVAVMEGTIQISGQHVK